MKYEVGKIYVQRLKDDKKGMYDVMVRVDQIAGDVMLCTIFADLYREATFRTKTGTRDDGEAFLMGEVD